MRTPTWNSMGKCVICDMRHGQKAPIALDAGPRAQEGWPSSKTAIRAPSLKASRRGDRGEQRLHLSPSVSHADQPRLSLTCPQRPRGSFRRGTTPVGFTRHLFFSLFAMKKS
jgi:hypothetical protein